jgi:hypothetical protein
MIYCDNQSYVKLSENPMFHDRTKHIEIKYYFLHDRVHRREVVLRYISTKEQITYILVKPPSKMKIYILKGQVGIRGDEFLIGKRSDYSQVGREH